jgi:hypothetical protein
VNEPSPIAYWLGMELFQLTFWVLELIAGRLHESLQQRNGLCHSNESHFVMMNFVTVVRQSPQ